MKKDNISTGRSKKITADSYFFITLLLAIWFCLTSWTWIYFANLFISFPFAALALIIMEFRKNDPGFGRYKYVKQTLIAGSILSGASFLILLCILIFGE